ITPRRGRVTFYRSSDYVTLATSRKRTDFRALCGSSFLLFASPSRKRTDWRPATTRRNDEMPIGTVKSFNDSKGYGFIAPEDGGQDAFVHITAVERAGLRTLSQNQKVSYDLEEDQRGKTKAVNIQAVEG